MYVKPLFGQSYYVSIIFIYLSYDIFTIFYFGNIIPILIFLIVQILLQRRMVMMALNMIEKVSYINAVVIVCVYFFEQIFFMFCLILTSGKMNIKDKGRPLRVHNKSSNNNK